MDSKEHKPYIVSWNLTRRCNLLCPHCYIDAQQEGPEELTREEARFVIDELSYLNSHLMLVLSGGEPMLREDIYEIVEYAAQAGFITVVGSNGTLLTEARLARLKDAGLKGIGISIDSTTAEKHDAFRGLDGAWELSISALKKAREMDLETQLDVTLTDDNVDEIDDFIELAVKLDVRAINFFFLVCTGRAMNATISKESYERSLNRIATLMMEEKRLMVRARCAPHIYKVLYDKGYSVVEGTRGCLAGRSYIRIDPEGNITPCPYMPLNVGNIKETSLVAIWEESSELQLLRKGVHLGRCGNCEYSVICGGCRARALADTGDIMAEDSLCRYDPSGEGSIDLDDNFESEFNWSDEARERIKKVPPFMKRMIIRFVESRAREEGVDMIDTEFLDAAKKKGYHGPHGHAGP